MGEEANKMKVTIPQRLSGEDLRKLAEYYAENLSEESLSYLRKKGIDEETTRKFHIGYEGASIGFHSSRGKLEGFFTNHIVFPVWNDQRDIVDLIGYSIHDDQPKYKTLIGVHNIFYNQQVLAVSEDILLCRDIFDVLILSQNGLPAVCVPGYSPFRHNHVFQLKGKRVFLCFPNNEVGRRESRSIYNMLDDVANEVFIVNLPKDFRDITHFFTSHQQALPAFLKILERIVEMNVQLPVESDVKNLPIFMMEYERRANGSVQGIATGINQLDKLLLGGLRNGLYLIRGSVSSGKSMLLRQIGDHIAKSSIPVVYVTWDLTAFELWARSVARILHTSPQNILSGSVKPDQVAKANEELSRWSKFEWTLEATLDTTMDDLENFIGKVMTSTGKFPVIMIDHLERLLIRKEDGQLVQNPSLAAHVLHQWSRHWNTPVVAVWLKETVPTGEGLGGLIEASVDVIITLETQEHSKDESRQKITLNLSKNRNGATGEFVLIFDKERAEFYPSLS